jgi:polar amino acid transport system substrate-binding protein
VIKFLQKITIVSILLANAAFAETITLVADYWCPFNCDPNSNKQGVMVEMARNIFAKENINVEYKIMPWKRAISDASNGVYEGVIGALTTDAVGFVFPENEQGVQKNTFYVKDDSDWKFDDSRPLIETLSQITLGVIADYSYGEEIDSYIISNKKDSNLVQFASGDNAIAVNIKKLIGSRIKVMVEEDAVMAYYLKSHQDEKFPIKSAGSFVNRNIGQDDRLFIAFSAANPNSARYAKILSDGMVEIRKSGELMNILNKYGLKDWRN